MPGYPDLTMRATPHYCTVVELDIPLRSGEATQAVTSFLRRRMSGEGASPFWAHPLFHCRNWREILSPSGGAQPKLLGKTRSRFYDTTEGVVLSIRTTVLDESVIELFLRFIDDHIDKTRIDVARGMLGAVRREEESRKWLKWDGAGITLYPAEPRSATHDVLMAEHCSVKADPFEKGLADRPSGPARPTERRGVIYTGVTRRFESKPCYMYGDIDELTCRSDDHRSNREILLEILNLVRPDAEKDGAGGRLKSGGDCTVTEAEEMVCRGAYAWRQKWIGRHLELRPESLTEPERIILVGARRSTRDWEEVKAGYDQVAVDWKWCKRYEDVPVDNR